MKRLVLSLTVIVLLGGLLTACGKKGDPVYHKGSEQSKTSKSSG